MLEFESRAIKKGDTLALKSGITKDSLFQNGDYVLDNTTFNTLNSLPTLFYAYFISDDGLYCKVQTKKTKGKKYDEFLLCEFFNIVKAPKMNDVVAWFYDNQPVVNPTQWAPFKNDIAGIARFVVKIFQTNLKAIYLINKTCNHLYFNHDPFETLMFYKTIVQQLKMSYHSRYAAFNKQTIRKSFIDTCLQLDPMWHRLDAIALYDMNMRNVFKDDVYISNENRLEWYKDPTKKVKAESTKESMAELDDLIVKNEAKKAEATLAKDSRYLKELNQEIIDELELVIFNVKTLHNRNQILMIFIDKDNNKRFYIAPFNFIFYVSNKTSIIENDYIVDYDEATHIPFSIQNFDVLRTLKFAVNDNHKRFMKVGKF
jgi:hypothetical protein